MKHTTFEMICVGDELLEGRVRDENAAYLGRRLDGVLRRVVMVTDRIDDVVAALRDATSDVVVVSGGLGPTDDDRTRIAAAKFVGEELVTHAESEAWIRQRFEERGLRFTENNIQQAMFPRSADVLATEVGSAPGFALTVDGRRYIFTPGVPREFAWFVERYVAPLLGETTHHEVLSFFGLGESMLEAEITELVHTAAACGGKIGFCARFPIIEVKFTGPDAWRDEAVAIARSQLQKYLIAESGETLAGRVGSRLNARKATVTTAESCTAGGIAAMLTDVAGSSAWFERAYVTYSNQAKVEELNVDLQALKEYGAVSEVVVRQMAVGARTRANATYALAVSGIAGPGGGSEEKPVGTVHFALATPHDVIHKHAVFRKQSRAAVRRLTQYTALQMLLAALEAGG